MLIYFAAPLFCQAEKAFNLQLTRKLEERGFTVFLPQRDGVDSNKPPYDEMTDAELRQAIFTLDRDKCLEAEIFLIVLDVLNWALCIARSISCSEINCSLDCRQIAVRHSLERNSIP
jgi:nucleoside 2-deoxyribosyltransferase